MAIPAPIQSFVDDAGGIPAHGNSTHEWDLEHPDHPNPEYRVSA
jgi:hypothetical protein